MKKSCLFTEPWEHTSCCSSIPKYPANGSHQSVKQTQRKTLSTLHWEKSSSLLKDNSDQAFPTKKLPKKAHLTVRLFEMVDTLKTNFKGNSEVTKLWGTSFILHSNKKLERILPSSPKEYLYTNSYIALLGVLCVIWQSVETGTCHLILMKLTLQNIRWMNTNASLPKLPFYP